MARRSLKPELNRIRAWVRQGRTDAWIAHQLEVTVQQIQTFKRDQQLGGADDADGPPEYGDEVDLRAEDDALIAAELDAAAAQAEQDSDGEGDDEDDEEAEDKPARRRRSRRGGRSARGRRRGSGGTLEATFEHGEEGYGLWLDPAVKDDPVYAEYWAGHRPVEVSIEEDQIVIRRAASSDAESDADAESDSDVESDSDDS
ncbi:MAG: hypothetical protein ACRDMX_01705 [Solirubrobacteraceae bacterium]